MTEKKKEMVLSERRYEACPVTDTSAGIPVKPVYELEDISDIKQEEIGKPGEYPFTRGIWKDMYRGKLWTRRVFTGLGTPSDTNKRYKYLIAHGESGLYCFGDTITHMGIDPDHPLAKGSAGVTGVSQFRQQDLNETFDGIDLENISVSFNNPSMAAAVVYSGFVNYAEETSHYILISVCIPLTVIHTGSRQRLVLTLSNIPLNIHRDGIHRRVTPTIFTKRVPTRYKKLHSHLVSCVSIWIG
jgi:methylmalonyl-CoA mutase N-terminal domain/subunit